MNGRGEIEGRKTNGERKQEEQGWPEDRPT